MLSVTVGTGVLRVAITVVRGSRESTVGGPSLGMRRMFCMLAGMAVVVDGGIVDLSGREGSNVERGKILMLILEVRVGGDNA